MTQGQVKRSKKGQINMREKKMEREWERHRSIKPTKNKTKQKTTKDANKEV